MKIYHVVKESLSACATDDYIECFGYYLKQEAAEKTKELETAKCLYNEVIRIKRIYVEE